MQNNSLVTTRHENVCFRISCAWISCLSRRMEAIDWRKLVAKREFDNPMDKHAVKVVLGNETVDIAGSCVEEFHAS